MRPQPCIKYFRCFPCFLQLFPQNRIPAFHFLRRHHPDIVWNLELLVVPGCRRSCLDLRLRFLQPRLQSLQAFLLSITPSIPDNTSDRELIIETCVCHRQIWESNAPSLSSQKSAALTHERKTSVCSTICSKIWSGFENVSTSTICPTDLWSFHILFLFENPLHPSMELYLHRRRAEKKVVFVRNSSLPLPLCPHELRVAPLFPLWARTSDAPFFVATWASQLLPESMDTERTAPRNHCKPSTTTLNLRSSTWANRDRERRHWFSRRFVLQRDGHIGKSAQ